MITCTYQTFPFLPTEHMCRGQFTNRNRDAEKMMNERNGTQAGDPPKGAKAMYQILTLDDPPLRVVIGTDAYDGIHKKIKDYGENYKKYEKISTSTDVDGYKKPS